MLLFTNILCYFVVILLIRTSVYGYLAKSALNPVFVLATFSMINAILFYVNFDSEWIYHPRTTFHSSLGDRIAAFSIFTVYNVALTVGITFDYFLKRNYRNRIFNAVSSSVPSSRSEESVTTILFFGTCAIALLYITNQFGVISLGLIQRITSDRFNLLGGAISFVYLTMVLRVFFLFYCYYQNFNTLRFYIAFVIMIFLMLMTGVRLNLFAVLIVVGVILVSRGYKFHYLYLILAFPAVGVLSISLRFFLRAHTHMGSLSELIQSEGGWSEIFLNPLELHYYQTITSIITLNLDKTINRIPGEEIWAAITLPIPRIIFPIKGESASSIYSEVINPVTWASAKSQATLGVFGVTLLEMGLVIGVLFIFLTGIVYSRLTIVYANKRGLIPLMIIFNLIVSTVIYHRSGITQLGQLVWPAVFSVLVYKVFISFRIKRIAYRFGSKK